MSYDKLQNQITEDPEKERSKWLSNALSESPHLLALRERSLPLVGGYSFSHLVHTDSTIALSHLDRYTLLELIFQHLESIGFTNTAETLIRESGHTFLSSEHKDWETTNLRMIISLALGPRDDPWELPTDIGHSYVKEEIEEDFYSSPYRENPETIWEEFFNPTINTVKNNNSENLLDCLSSSSLKRVIVIVVTTTSSSIQDEAFQKIFLIIHSITSSNHFFQHLMSLFFLKGTDSRINSLSEDKIKEIRMNVINIIKKWVTFHGLFIGRQCLKSIQTFSQTISEEEIFKDFKKYGLSLLNQLPHLIYGTKQGVTLKPNPPVISNPQVILKPNLTILDPDPIEVARQITLIAHDVFSNVHSREFIVAFSNKKATIHTPTLNEFLNFGKKLSLLVTETFLNSDNPTFAYQR